MCIRDSNHLDADVTAPPGWKRPTGRKPSITLTAITYENDPVRVAYTARGTITANKIDGTNTCEVFPFTVTEINGSTTVNEEEVKFTAIFPLHSQVGIYSSEIRIKGKLTGGKVTVDDADNSSASIHAEPSKCLKPGAYPCYGSTAINWDVSMLLTFDKATGTHMHLYERNGKTEKHKIEWSVEPSSEKNATTTTTHTVESNC